MMKVFLSILLMLFLFGCSSAPVLSEGGKNVQVLNYLPSDLDCTLVGDTKTSSRWIGKYDIIELKNSASNAGANFVVTNGKFYKCK